MTISDDINPDDNSDQQLSLQVFEYVEQQRKLMLDKIQVEQQKDTQELATILETVWDTPTIDKFLNKWGHSTSADFGSYGMGWGWIAAWINLRPIIDKKIKDKYTAQRVDINKPEFFRSLLLQDKKEKEAPSIFTTDIEHLGTGGRYVYDVNSPCRHVCVSTNKYRKRQVERNSLTQAVRSYGTWTQYEVDIPPPPPEVRYGNQSDGNNH